MSEVKQRNFYPGMQTHEAGWSGRGCGRVGDGLWHKEAMCAILNCRGSWLPSPKAQGCSLPALITVVTAVKTVSRLGLQSFRALGPGLGTPGGRVTAE